MYDSNRGDWQSLPGLCPTLPCVGFLLHNIVTSRLCAVWNFLRCITNTCAGRMGYRFNPRSPGNGWLFKIWNVGNDPDFHLRPSWSLLTGRTRILWSEESAYDAILVGKHGFLNIPFYMKRLIVYAAIWVGFTYVLRKNSLKKMQMVVWIITESQCLLRPCSLFVCHHFVNFCMDFLMSIDSHWFSTLFGWTPSSVYSSADSHDVHVYPLPERPRIHGACNRNQLHDVGKLCLPLRSSDYLWFSQFMLIWYCESAWGSDLFLKCVGKISEHSGHWTCVLTSLRRSSCLWPAMQNVRWGYFG